MKPGMIENDMQNAMTITIHPDKAVGPVKPVNGVGQPPMVGALKDWPMMHYRKEAGIPFSRLHDVGGYFGGGLYVDIPNLFPDFDADDWIRLSCVCPGAVSECRITDADRTDEAVAMPSEMPPRSFLVAISE